MAARAKAVVVFSGGLDSVCTAVHLSDRYELYGVSFLYGQRAGPEIDAARRLAGVLRMGAHRILDISFMDELYGDSNALTNPGMAIPESFDYSIVVPVRNGIFLSIASAWAFSLGAEMVAYGAHTGDEHYPDCRPVFAERMQDAMNSGEADGISSGKRRSIRVWSPYMDGMSKSELLRVGHDMLGDEVFAAWSCYRGGANHCGVCESCQNRKRAFAGANIADKTTYDV